MFLSENTNSQILHPCSLICFHHIGLILICVKRELTSASAAAAAGRHNGRRTHVQHIVVLSGVRWAEHTECSPSGDWCHSCAEGGGGGILPRLLDTFPSTTEEGKKKSCVFKGFFSPVFFFFSKGPREAASVLDLLNEV